jgi:hypothetical protein
MRFIMHAEQSELDFRHVEAIFWVDNIKMDLGEIGRDGRDWIELAQDRDRWRALVNTVMNLRGSLKLLGIF